MKPVKYVLSIIVAFVAGYYSAIYVVNDKVDTVKTVSEITISKINELSAASKANDLLHTLEVESDILNQLVNIHDSGIPIKIAIKDSATKLKREIDRSSEYISDIPEDQRTRITNKIDDIKSKNGDIIFHFVNEKISI